MSSLLPSLVVLGLAAFAALGLTLWRGSPPANAEARRRASTALAVAVGVQAIHFGEELATGFPRELGPLFGLPEMSLAFFVAFNVAWLGIWVASVPAVRSARSWAFFAAWFLAIAGMANGILHPLLSLGSGHYFPGLVTAPVAAAVGLWLFLRLRAATSPQR